MIPDRPELDASLPTTDSPRTARTGPESAELTEGTAGGGPQDVRVPGDGLYRRDGLPESADHETENRFQPVRQRIPRFVASDRLR